MILKPFSVVLIGLTLLLSSRGQAQTHYYHFKEQRLLKEKPGKIAVMRRESVSNREVSASLIRAGVKTDNIEPAGIEGWWIGEAAATSIKSTAGTTTPATRGLVSTAAADTANDFVSPVFEGINGADVIVTPTMLVRFSEGVSSAQARVILHNNNAGLIIEENWANMPGAYKIRATARDGYTVLGITNTLATLPEVRFAEPDMIFTGHGDLVPNDPGFNFCWGIDNTGQAGGTSDEDMDGAEAWDITTGDPTIKIAVIDTGVEHNHPDLNVLPGADVTDEDVGSNVPGDPLNACDKHGTAVAGCISAIINNGAGTVGIAPACGTLSIRTFVSLSNCSGSWISSSSWTVDALTQAEILGVNVTNNSNSYGFVSSAIDAKYAQTRAGGMVHFASSGNQNAIQVGYPASIPAVNAIAATNRDGIRAGFSNQGIDLAFAAPGVGIYSTDMVGVNGFSGGDYASVTGTSFAAPYAAGVAGLILSVQPTLTAAQVEEIMRDTAVDKGTSGFDTSFGWGVINAHKALLSLMPSAASDWQLFR